jgi:hypothetical protein
MNLPFISKKRAPAPLFLRVTCIDLFLEKASSPILEPGLHPESAESLLRLADDFDPRNGYEIVLEVPAEDMDRGEEVRVGVQNWSKNQAKQVSQNIRSTIRKSVKAVSLALLLVAGLLVMVEWLKLLGEGRLYTLFGESVIIIAWVSLWVPVETLLVEPIHLRRRKHMFNAISRANLRLEQRN